MTENVATEIDVLNASRYLQMFDIAACRAGLHISMGDDFSEYVEITKRIDGKTPTYPNFHPAHSRIGPGEGFWLIGEDDDRSIAHVQAVRLYDLDGTNLAEHLQSLRALYAEPETQAPKDASCRCASQGARTISGKVAYHGDLWLRKDFRKKRLARVLAGLVFGVALAKWQPDYIFALVPTWLKEKGIASEYGYIHHEAHGSVLNLPSANISDDDWLIWLSRDELAGLAAETIKAPLPLPALHLASGLS